MNVTAASLQVPGSYIMSGTNLPVLPDFPLSHLHNHTITLPLFSTLLLLSISVSISLPPSSCLLLSFSFHLWDGDLHKKLEKDAEEEVRVQ